MSENEVNRIIEAMRQQQSPIEKYALQIVSGLILAGTLAAWTMVSNSNAQLQVVENELRHIAVTLDKHTRSLDAIDSTLIDHGQRLSKLEAKR